MVVKRSHFLLSLLMLLILLLTACGDSNGSQAGNKPSTQAGTKPQTGVSSATIGQGTFAEYPLPQPKSGLMRPVIDHQGRVWVAEMGNNALAVFDPRTQQFQQVTPPHARGGLMGTLIAPDDSVWFSEQLANYIGRYDPVHNSFQQFDLPTVQIPDPGTKNSTLTLPSAPNDLALDKQGNIWFTEMNTDSIGRLEVKTGRFTHYPVSAQHTVQKYSPYGITLDPQGRVWFTAAATNTLSRLDPATGRIQVFTPPASSGPLMEVATDSSGTIWATTFNSATLLRFDPQQATFSTYLAPDADKGISGMYGLTITPQNEIWVTIAAPNVIAHFDAATTHFTYYQIPTENSSPLGLAADADHTLWFSESLGNQLGKLKTRSLSD